MLLVAEACLNKKRRMPAWLVAVLAIVTICLAFPLALQTDPQADHALKTPGAIIGVTRDGETLTLGANWQRVLLRIAPQLQKQIGGRVLLWTRAAKSPDSLIIWKNLGRSGSDLLLLYEGPFAGTVPVRIIDDQGKKQELQAQISPADLDFGESIVIGCALEPAEIAKLPKSSRELRVSLAWEVPRGTGHPELTIPNPAFRP